MGTWASLSTDLLWRHALAAIPLETLEVEVEEAREEGDEQEDDM